jgi:hypothetical protein
MRDILPQIVRQNPVIQQIVCQAIFRIQESTEEMVQQMKFLLAQGSPIGSASAAHIIVKIYSNWSLHRKFKRAVSGALSVK